jgi:hypothetical protein
VIDHKERAQKEEANSNYFFLRQLSDSRQPDDGLHEHSVARLLIGAAYIGTLIETQKNDPQGNCIIQHRYARRTADPEEAAAEYHCIAAAFGIGPLAVGVGPLGCVTSPEGGIRRHLEGAHVTEAGMASATGLQFTRALWQRGVPIAFRPATACTRDELAWVDLRNA